MTCPHCRAANPEGAHVCASCQEPLGFHALPPGRLVADRYLIVKALGTGGMGQVFEAHDRKLEVRVAIKILRGSIQDPESLSRLRSEVKLARKVRHRHVCTIYDYGEDGDIPFISMELVEGQDLRHLVHEQGPLDWEPAYEIVLQMAEGLVAIHEAGIIHRDLKPANIMIDLGGRARVMDFGIAKVGASTESSLTQTGHVVGTPEYMSPEQIRAREVDFRSDLYAFGVVIFEVFTGLVPFHASTPVGTMLLHLEEPPPLEPPPARLPQALVPVLRRALAKDMGDRYASGAEMLEALRLARQALPADRTEAVAVPEEEVPSGERPTELVRRASPRPAPALPEEARLLVPMLTQALGNAQGEVRLSAARCLMRHGPVAAAAVPQLQALCNDPDPRVREQAEQSLLAIAPPALPVLAVASPPTPRPTPAAGTPPSAPARAGPPALEPDSSPAVAESPSLAATDPHLHAMAVPVAAAPPAAASPEPPAPSIAARPAAPRPAAPRPGPRRREPEAPRPSGTSASSRWLWTAIAAGLSILAVLALPPVRGIFVPTPTTTSTTTTTTTTTATLPEVPPTLTVAGGTGGPIRVTPSTTVPVATTPTTVPVATTTTTTTTTTVPPELPTTTTSSTTTTTTTTTTLPPLVPPVCLKCPLPDYPVISQQRRVQGTVQLRLLVDETGRVAEVQVVKSPGQVVKEMDALWDAAVKAASARTYRPAHRGDIAEKMWVLVSMDFKLPD